ncbi:MAG TPA: dienelactone hydrolase family protein [Candidatus Polarisedimenticolia bacterium]|nr:dienelactone hydrolase family protein [Candidatus Polarisedimenticolia bacterium]
MPDFEQLTFGDRTARAYVRIPDGATAGVVVLHAWWGLNDDVIAYADRLADAGFGVLAPDMFNGQVTAEIPEAERLSGEGDASSPEVVAFNAVDRLAERLPTAARIATLAFSFGAPYATWTPSERPAVVGTVVYYGAWADSWVTKSNAPLLGHFAEDDPFTSAEEVSAFETAFRNAGRAITTHVYPGTKHWFAEPSRPEFDSKAAELAFERTGVFLRRVMLDQG